MSMEEQQYQQQQESVAPQDDGASQPSDSETPVKVFDFGGEIGTATEQEIASWKQIAERKRNWEREYGRREQETARIRKEAEAIIAQGRSQNEPPPKDWIDDASAEYSDLPEFGKSLKHQRRLVAEVVSEVLTKHPAMRVLADTYENQIKNQERERQREERANGMRELEEIAASNGIPFDRFIREFWVSDGNPEAVADAIKAKMKPSTTQARPGTRQISGPNTPPLKGGQGMPSKDRWRADMRDEDAKAFWQIG